MTTIHLEGAKELIARITSLQAMRRVKKAIIDAAGDLRKKVTEYPTPSHRPNLMLRGNSAKAQRMRAGFFARLKSGEIEVPYRRGQSPGSKKLGQSWTVKTENAGFRAIIGTGVSYSRLVQDSAKQTSYHRHTGWITTKQVTQLYGRQAMSKIEAALKSEVENG